MRFQNKAHLESVIRQTEKKHLLARTYEEACMLREQLFELEMLLSGFDINGNTINTSDVYVEPEIHTHEVCTAITNYAILD